MAEGAAESSKRFTLRRAGPDDAAVLADLILELSDYERLRHEAAPDVDALRRHLEGDDAGRCGAFLAEETTTGRAVGFALYFLNYSTFLTRWGVYLEDLYVQPAWRGLGAGFALLREVARVAAARECGRMEWAVLNWNEPAIDFYRRIGARAMDEWTTMRLDGEGIQRLAAS